jgi:hypothetical protein
MVEIVSKDVGGRMKAGKRECEGYVKRCQVGKCQVNSEAETLGLTQNWGKLTADRRRTTALAVCGQKMEALHFA